MGGIGFIGQLERIMKAKIWAQGEELRRKTLTRAKEVLPAFAEAI